MALLLGPLLAVAWALCFRVPSAPAPFVQPAIFAPAFAWPSGCPKAPYMALRGTDRRQLNVVNSGFDLLKACFPERNAFHERDRYGLPTGKGVGRYYRIDNDLASASCSLWGKCRINYVDRDAFHQ